MHDPHAEAMRAITRAVLEGPGRLDPAVRQAAADGGPVPDALTRYVDEVRRYAYRVTDDDVRALLAAGYTEDQIFELTLSAALGAGLDRLRVGLAALQSAEHEGTWTMRLKRLDGGHRLPQKLMMRIIRIMSRDPQQPLDIIKTMLYRPEYFGKRASNLYHELLRGPSEWSIGERELFAAFTSSLNTCRFWTGAHGAVASLALGDEVTLAVLADFETAPIGAPLRATLTYLRALTLTPESITPKDTRAVLASGVSSAALTDAIYICALFNTMDRIADALGFAIPPDFASGAGALLTRGYKM